METLLTFVSALVISYLGSIPPGTLNLTIVQLGLEKKIHLAWRFAIAASIIEYFYAWIAVAFEKAILQSPSITENIQLFSALVLLVLGLLNLFVTRRASPLAEKISQSGFRRGLLMGVLNPLAIPFWIGMTAYLKSLKVIRIESVPEVHVYLLGVALGGMALLISLAYLANRISHWKDSAAIKRIPGAMLLVLGIYGLVDYFLG